MLQGYRKGKIIVILELAYCSLYTTMKLHNMYFHCVEIKFTQSTKFGGKKIYIEQNFMCKIFTHSKLCCTAHVICRYYLCVLLSCMYYSNVQGNHIELFIYSTLS